ncbi:MAG: hypothetical protein ACK5MO_23755 [Planctomyces sp.]
MNRLPLPALRLFNPDAVSDLVDSVDPSHDTAAASLGAVIAEGDVDVIPFEAARRALVLSGRFTPTLRRARMIHANSQCCDCGGHDVEPMELDDAGVSFRNGAAVPGTATIIGFHCNDCGGEWPVYEISRRVQK